MSGAVTDRSAVELAELIRARDISCAEVAVAYLDRIGELNPLVNAIVSARARGDVLADARQRDRELAQGNWRGWAHGMPIAIKDLSDVVGMRTTLGSPIFADRALADTDAPHVARLRSAGAVFVGKTNTPEFGLGSQTFNPVFGPTRNAYDQRLCAGGSSGGAAVAIALRMLPVADGTDFMGSLRNPAAFNNIVGFRPSIGRVPEPGFLSSPAVAGPMGRTVRDVAALLSVLAGPDPYAPSSIEEDPAVFAGPLDPPIRSPRLAWIGDFNGYLATEPGVLDLCEVALELMHRDLGWTVEVATFDMAPAEVWDCFVTWRHMLTYENLRQYYRDPRTRGLLKPEAVWELERGARLRVDDLVTAHEQRKRWFRAVTELLDCYDAIAAPTAQVFPFDVDISWPRSIGGRPMDTYHRWMETVAPWSLAGLPALNVPVGFDEHDRPMGLQIIGRSHGDLDVLRIGAAYDDLTQWARRRPPAAAALDGNRG